MSPKPRCRASKSPVTCANRYARKRHPAQEGGLEFWMWSMPMGAVDSPVFVTKHSGGRRIESFGTSVPFICAMPYQVFVGKHRGNDKQG